MFRHRNCGRRARAVSVGILTSAIIVTAARAAETPAPFVFVAYSNRTGGEKLASGDYATASQAVYGGAPRALMPDPQALDTNRCVAYTMTQQLSLARTACDAAVRDTREADSSAPSFSPQTRRQSDVAAAVAYSNRAVLHWLDADLKAAQADLARAQALAPQASFVTRNVSAMRTRQNVIPQHAAAAPAAPLASE